jgi:hypothetical protein
MSNEPRERFMSYYKGWRDGAGIKSKDALFTEGAARPDLKAEYERGYADGRRANGAASKRAAKRLGYTPTVLRLAGAALIAGSCANTPVVLHQVPVPLLSPAMDAMKLAPPATDAEQVKVAPGALDYPDQPVPAKNTCGLPMGVLVSETAYAHLTAEQAELRRRRAEGSVLLELRAAERANCEAVYQAQSKRILELETKLAEPPSWWDRHKFEVGVLTGLGLTVGAGYAVGQAAR